MEQQKDYEKEAEKFLIKNGNPPNILFWHVVAFSGENLITSREAVKLLIETRKKMQNIEPEIPNPETQPPLFNL